MKIQKKNTQNCITNGFEMFVYVMVPSSSLGTVFIQMGQYGLINLLK